MSRGWPPRGALKADALKISQEMIAEASNGHNISSSALGQFLEDSNGGSDPSRADLSARLLSLAHRLNGVFLECRTTEIAQEVVKCATRDEYGPRLVEICGDFCLSGNKPSRTKLNQG